MGEIIKDRQVLNVWVLERIADGLGIPRAWMGLSYGEEGPEAPSIETEVSEDMQRRALIAATLAAAVGQAVQGVGEPIEIVPAHVGPLPSRLGIPHVRVVRAVTDRLAGVTRYCGGQADLFGAAVTLYTRWMQVPATEAVKAQLAAALADLHTDTGWSCYDSGADGTGYFIRALRLAGKAAEAHGIAKAAWQAGLTLGRSGHPNDALKLFQLGRVHLRGAKPAMSTPAALRTDDSWIPTLTARLSRSSATAYALLGGFDEATRCLAEARDGWEPEMRSSTREGILWPRELSWTWAGSIPPSSSPSVPLAAALEARPGSDARELARTARQIAETRT
ncbi:MAG: hypothetical protein JO063_12455 [Pseudonocardiales bacterium]|nr:hypothetical protein [Pseudonocardiales bacterium]MBV9029339.1 hypothetical protein [Pseudonocardiales bacterium]MBW0010901.1 hypothetical protein [Pseudonocardiales bacterium]